MFMPDKYPEFGQCVHKIALHPALVIIDGPIPRVAGKQDPT
jgi:hypothetical protein